MSVLWRIFKVKTKSLVSSTASPSSDDAANGDGKAGDWDGDPPPNLERSRHRGDRMSVSRSGRFKQRSRRRSALFDNPNLSGRKGEYENDENNMQQANSEVKVTDLDRRRTPGLAGENLPAAVQAAV